MFREDGTTLHETRPPLRLEGEWTLAGFCEVDLATLELWPQPPEWDIALRPSQLGVRVVGTSSSRCA